MELRLGREDLLERRVGDAAEADERVAHLLVLRRDLRLVGEILEAAAAARREVGARRVDPRRARRTTSVAVASAKPRLTFVTVARTVSPGRPRRTKTTNPFSRATPFPP